MGEIRRGALRVNFDRKLKLEFSRQRVDILLKMRISGTNGQI